MQKAWGEPAWEPDGWEVKALSSVRTVSPQQYDLMSVEDQLKVVKTPEGEKLTLVHIQRRLQAELPGKSAMSFNMQVRRCPVHLCCHNQYSISYSMLPL